MPGRCSRYEAGATGNVTSARSRAANAPVTSAPHATRAPEQLSEVGRSESCGVSLSTIVDDLRDRFGGRLEVVIEIFGAGDAGDRPYPAKTGLQCALGGRAACVFEVPPGSERPLLRCPPKGRPGTRSDSRTRISRLGFASNRGGLGRAAVPNIRRRDASNASGGLRRRLGLARHCAGGAGKPARRQLHEARAVGDREGDHGASEGAADDRRPQRGHAPHAHAGIHGISRVREGDVGEGRLRRPLRDVQHARVARDGAGGAPAGLADQQVVQGRHRRRRQLAVGGHDRL